MMRGIAFAAAARDMAFGFIVVAGAISFGIAIGYAVGRWL